MTRYDHWGCVELNAAPGALLALLQDHIGDHFELDHTIKLPLLLDCEFVPQLRHREVVVFAVGAAEVYLLLFVAVSLDSGTHSLDDYHGLRAGLSLRKDILAWELNTSLEEAG